MGNPYYEQVQEAYDRLAPRYDDRTLQNPIHLWMRAASLRLLYESFQKKDRILELGCGTGEEAVRLASRGVEVLATDMSSEMLRITEEKARRRDVGDLVETRRMGIHEVSNLVEEFGGASFDGAYASYSLVYEPTLEFLPRSLATLIRSEGYFVSSVRNRVCIFEILLYAATLRIHRAMERWRQPSRFQVSGKDLAIRSYTVGEYVSMFQDFFRTDRLIGIPVLLPPPHLYPKHMNIMPSLTHLQRLEKRLRGTSPFNKLGDHTLARMQRLREVQ